MNTLIKSPFSVGTLHFIGIGGIGMSGIAEIFSTLGYKVQGSDVQKNANVERLLTLGIKVHIGHEGDNVGSADVVIVSSAIKADNPELVEAHKRFLPIMQRADMLAELMRLKWAVTIAGTHGKTTTTSLVGHVLQTAGIDPTVVIGGVLNAWGTNARIGQGDWLVAEADESDGSFLRLPSTMAVITNIDPEHLDHYGNFEKLKAAFVHFIRNLPFYGYAVLCIDHSEVQALLPKVQERRIITYGLSPQASIRAMNIEVLQEGMRFDVVFQHRVSEENSVYKGIEIKLRGKHNVQNSLAAIAIADKMGISMTHIQESLKTFEGVDRRFSKIGVVDGITIIDDYAHHPVEIEAVLSAARDCSKGKIIAVFQPHRYSRLRDNFKGFCLAFNKADAVIISDVYPAGEAPIKGYTGQTLADGIQAHGHLGVSLLPTEEALAGMVSNLAAADDMVVIMGAGNCTLWAKALPENLKRIRHEQ